MSTTKKATSNLGVNTKAFTKFDVLQKVWHRNGISGLGFWALWVRWPEEGYETEREAVITIDGSDVDARKSKKRVDPATRVLMLDSAGGVDLENTMRGDFFHDALVDWLNKNDH